MSYLDDVLARAKEQERLLAAAQCLIGQNRAFPYLRMGLAALFSAFVLLIPISGAACPMIL